MSFGHPLLLLTLLVIPAAIALLVLAESRRMRYAVRFTNLDVLAGVVGGRSLRRHVPAALFLLALVAACVAVARPHAKTLVPQERATVILVIDVSRSMDASDVKPTRLLAAQAAVRGFLDRVPKRVRVGLIAFAGLPSVVTPPTTDRDLLEHSLQYIADYGGFGGTAIGDAVAAAVRLGEQAVSGNGNLAAVTTATGAAHGLVSVLFLSDGAQTRGDLLPLQGADRAKAAGIPVYTVALGTPGGTLSRDPNFGGGGFPGGGNGGGGGGGNGFGFGNVPVPPDPATLRAIADRTGGQFFEARSSNAVKAAYSKLGSKLGRKPAKTEITYEFLAAAAALLVAAGLLSARWSPRLP
jgi:Ca-activated chloride channel family protein